MKVPPEQIASLARDAGFAGDDLVTAVAVALAESGGDPEAYNPETAAGTAPGRGSYGLWQIYRAAHPDLDAVDLTDPPANARAAFQIYSAARGFRPWSTYLHGLHEQFMPTARDAVANPAPYAGGSVSGGGFMGFVAFVAAAAATWWLTSRYLTR